MISNELDIIEKDNIIGIRKDTPIDLTLIQSAIFSRNKNAAKIKEINLDNLDILIRAVKGHTIPNAFDEDIFFAILHLFVKFKDIWRLDYIPRTIYLTYSDLCNVLDIGTQYIDRIRVSLDKLASTSYKFTNSFLYRDISTNLFNLTELNSDDIKEINKDTTAIICENVVYNDIDLSSKKVRTFLIVNTKSQLQTLLSQLNIQEENVSAQLTAILNDKPLIKLHNTNESKLEHLLNIFDVYTIQNMQVFLDEDEFLSDIRDEVSGTKITDFKVKRNSATSTFNLINFVEYKIDDYQVSDMLVGAKLNKENFTSVKAFLENKITSKSKYMLRIDMNNYMYENIINKVYLKHSLKYLLDFTDKTARGLYLFMEGSKGIVIKKNKNIVRLSNPNLVIIDVELLAAYVNLSMDSKAISGTVNSLMRAMEYLRSNGYIKNYITHREKPLRNSYFKVEFHIEQNRNHPEFKPYSIKVLPKSQGEEEQSNNGETDKIFQGVPDIIKSSILEINNITEENIDALVQLYTNNQDKKVFVREKPLTSNLGALMVLAIVKKITTTLGIRSMSAYLYKTISSPKIYAAELVELKANEYNELYGTKAKAKENEEKEKLLKEQKNQEIIEKLKQTQVEINNKWEALGVEEKEKYLLKAQKLIKLKNIPSSFHEIMPRSLYAKQEFGAIYDSFTRLYVE